MLGEKETTYHTSPLPLCPHRNELPSPGRSHNTWDAETLSLTLNREGFPHDEGIFGGLKSLTSLILRWMKGVSFERNCGAASAGECNREI